MRCQRVKVTQDRLEFLAASSGIDVEFDTALDRAYLPVGFTTYWCELTPVEVA